MDWTYQAGLRIINTAGKLTPERIAEIIKQVLNEESSAYQVQELVLDEVKRARLDAYVQAILCDVNDFGNVSNIIDGAERFMAEVDRRCEPPKPHNWVTPRGASTYCERCDKLRSQTAGRQIDGFAYKDSPCEGRAI